MRTKERRTGRRIQRVQERVEVWGEGRVV